jgi:translation elongation factor EF-Tu-like GTPase
VRELLSSYDFPATHPDHQGLGLAALKASDPEIGENAILKLMAGGRQLHPAAGASDRQAVPDADRRRVLDLGPRHRCDRPCRDAASSRLARKSRSSASSPRRRRPCTGVEMFRKLLDQGQAGDNIGALLRGIEA